MKRITLLFAAIMLAVLAVAQDSKRMRIPKLSFSDSTQKSLYNNVVALYSDRYEAFGFEDEELLPCWKGVPHKRMALAFLEYSMISQSNGKERVYSDRDVVEVGRAMIEWGMKEDKVSCPPYYPFNYHAYQEYVMNLLAPLAPKVDKLPQYLLNAYARTESNLKHFLSMLKFELVRNRIKPANLRSALLEEGEAWSALRGELEGMYGRYKYAINGGIYYSMLPLELSSFLQQADKERNISVSVLDAISRDEIGAIYPPISADNYTDSLQLAISELNENKVDTSRFDSLWGEFLSAREAVANLLSPKQKQIYEDDIQRYYKLLLQLTE